MIRRLRGLHRIQKADNEGFLVSLRNLRIVQIQNRLNREWIKWRVAKDPEAQNDEEQHPDVLRVEPISIDRAITHDCVGMAYQDVKQKRQRRHQKRIKLKRSNQVAMDQSV